MVLGELGERERSIRTIVGSGRATLDALAANTGSLQQGVEELPRLLDAGRSTLGEVQPLLGEARPARPQARSIWRRACDPAFEQGAPFSIGPISSDLVEIIKRLPAQRRASERVLPEVTKLDQAVCCRSLRRPGPAALNTVPIADYLAPRIDSIGAFYANGTERRRPLRRVGRYARFAILPTRPRSSTARGRQLRGGVEPAGESWCSTPTRRPTTRLDQPAVHRRVPAAVPYEPPTRQVGAALMAEGRPGRAPTRRGWRRASVAASCSTRRSS